GDDELSGNGGNDTIHPGAGTDSANGGNGGDLVAYSDVAGPITVNLGTGQATGAGTDTLSSVEKAIGTQAADTLIGNAGPNTLNGMPWPDTIEAGNGSNKG